jgi:hypothetical protein
MPSLRRTLVGLVLVVGATLGLVVAEVVLPSSSGPLSDRGLPSTASAAPPIDSFPAAVSANQRYLLDTMGRPYLLHGDSAWSLVVELTKGEALRYLDDRRDKGFNVLLTSIIENKFSSQPPLTADGHAPFLGTAFQSAPNEFYWQHVDWLVDAAAARGITFLFVPTYLGYSGTDEGWAQEVEQASEQEISDFGAFLGTRYRNDPNIIWAIGGDQNGFRTKMNALAAGIRSTDPNHLMTAHTGPDNTASGVYGSSSWLDIDNVYSYGAPAEDTADAYDSATRPLFFIEGVYENEQGAPVSRVRTQAWASMLSGASGQIFGNNPIWHFASGGLYPTPLSWQEALNGPGSRHMEVLRSLFDSLPWHRLSPDRADQFLVDGESSGLSRAAAAISTADGLAVVYVPSSRSIGIDLGRLSPASVRLRWYDPTNGSFREVGTFTTSGRQTLTTPGSNAVGDRDWVLVVSAVGPAPQPDEGFFASQRMLDTRAGHATIDGQYAGIGTRAAGSVTEVQVAGRGSVPADATAAVVNLTVVRPTAAGYATVYPCGQPVPNASNINYAPDQIVANAVVTNLDNNGRACIYTLSAAHLVLDTSGTFPASTEFDAFASQRMLDTRAGHATIDGQYAGIGTRAAGSVTEVQVAGRGSVPADATAAVVNLTVVRPTAAGYATVYPCGQPVPNASNINYAPDQIVANAVVTNLDNNGRACIYTLSAAHLVLDTSGTFPASTEFDAFASQRMLDTRAGHATIDGQYAGIGTRAAGSVTEVQVAGRGSVPADATAAVVNLTVVRPTAAGYATVYPCGQPVPNASNTNYAPDQIVANAVVTNLDNNGRACIYTLSAAHLVLDTSGSIPPG